MQSPQPAGPHRSGWEEGHSICVPSPREGHKVEGWLWFVLNVNSSDQSWSLTIAHSYRLHKPALIPPAPLSAHRCKAQLHNPHPDLCLGSWSSSEQRRGMNLIWPFSFSKLKDFRDNVSVWLNHHLASVPDHELSLSHSSRTVNRWCLMSLISATNKLQPH